MIIAENPKPSLEEFRSLMSKIDDFLNNDALLHPDYYASKSGLSLEPDIRDVAIECAKNTKFEGAISLVSGASFPDIVAAKYYGIEVKSTQKDQWTSIGSSILESTRISDVERIYITFGKLGKPIKFLSRPYEQCMSDIAVTHYPRYKIDMMLEVGESIFDKMNLSYDTLRNMDNPVEPVANYYKSKLKEGESLWWTGNAVDSISSSVPMTVKLWSTLSPEEKRYYESRFYVFFPECILGTGNKKYSRVVLWLATQCGIINSNVRDSFSAGGQVKMRTMDNSIVLMPKIFDNIQRHIVEFSKVMLNTEPSNLFSYWGVPISKNRFEQWINLVVSEERNTQNSLVAKSVLARIFFDNGLI